MIRKSGYPSPRLTAALDGHTLRAFQEATASITHLPTVLCDPKGRPLIGVSGATEALSILKGSPGGRQRFLEFCAHLTAAPEEKVHELLFFQAAQIVHEEQLLGAIVVGGVPTRSLSTEQAARIAEDFELEPSEFKRLQSALQPPVHTAPETTLSLIQVLASVLSVLAGRGLPHEPKDLLAYYDMTSIFAGSQDLQVVLDTIARKVCDVMNVRSCSIRLLDDSTGELVIKAVHNLSPEYINKGAIILDENPIDRDAFNGEAVYVEDTSSDPRIRFPEQAQNEGIVSGLSVGMTYRGETIGVMRVYTGEKHHFDASETATLRSVASQAAAAIINSRLYLEAVQAQHYERQLNYAGDIQRRMVPASPPGHRHIDLATIYEPSYQVGGDFYDFITWEDSEDLGVCIADVVGEGIPAALLMASLRTAFRIYARSVLEITEVMPMINMHMAKDSLIGEFATLFYGVFSENGRSLTFSCAGHDPPLLSHDGKITHLKTDDFVIGIEPQESYHTRRIRLRKGDAIAFYTDGMVDARNFVGDYFGRQRLEESFIRHARGSASQIVQNMIWDVRRFVGLADQADDMTLLVAKIQ